MSILQEFKEFALKGNVVDLAVAVIIGGGFGKIVTSLVTDVVMPPVGIVVGGMKFADMKVILKPEHLDPHGKLVEAVTLNYGNFIQVTVDFLIIAFVAFLAVKMMHHLRNPKPETPSGTVLPPQEQLLTEIRDLIKKKA